MTNYTKTGKNRYILFNLVEKTQVLEGIGLENVRNYLLENDISLSMYNQDIKPILKNKKCVIFNYIGLIVAPPISASSIKYVIIDNMTCIDELLLSLPSVLIESIIPKLKSIRRKNKIGKLLKNFNKKDKNHVIRYK